MKNGSAPKSGSLRVRVIERAIAVLNCFSTAQEQYTLQQLVEKTGLPKDTVLRISGTLIQTGILVQQAPGPTYSLGYIALTMPRLVLQSSQLRMRGLAVIREIRDLVNETCILSARIENEVFNIEKAQSSHIIDRAPIMGRGLLLHESGTGIAIFNTFDSDQQDSYFRQHGISSADIALLATVDRATG